MYPKPITIHVLDTNATKFIKGSSPPSDEDISFEEPEVPTEIDSDDQVFVGQKRASNTSPTDPR